MEQQVQLDSISTTLFNTIKDINDKFMIITNQMSTMMEMITSLDTRVSALEKELSNNVITNVKLIPSIMPAFAKQHNIPLSSPYEDL